MIDRTVVVAGNGPSISELDRGRVLRDDFIIRTNNFFFEPEFYLGRRVDMAFIGGDPRVSRFIFETLYQCRTDYDIKSWSTHAPRVARAGQRRFAGLYKPMMFRDDAIESETRALMARYDRTPTTGIHAVLMAHAMGAADIILAGVDLYATAKRYSYQLGPNYQALMGQDLAERGADLHLHDPDLDLAILSALNARGDVRLFRAVDNAALAGVTEMAPLRDGDVLIPEPRVNPPRDWASRSGLYSIEMLKVLRRGSAFLRSLKRGS